MEPAAKRRHVPSETSLFRVLCPTTKAASLTSLIRHLQTLTGTKIHINSFSSSSVEDECVIHIISNSNNHKDRVSTATCEEEEENKEDEEDNEGCSPAQQALLRIFDRMVRVSGDEKEKLKENDREWDGLNSREVFSCRLLVASSQVGCVLGRGGKIVEKIRHESGAQVRVLSKDHLPPCASAFTLLTLSYTLVPAMAVSVTLFLVVFVALVSLGLVSSAKFEELFQPSWAMDHFMYEGELLKLKLDNFSGAGFASKSKYMFGKVSIQIKLVEGDSAGTVTAFYMSSDGPNHNEFDFEFLGNTTGEPYSVQTNVYVNGVGNREQRLNLWFDPTTEFHSYSLFWNQRQVVFLVDETPIRVHTNMENKGIPFPKDQAMGVYSSIWNADDWATQGGRVKTDWTHAPFIATYKNFEIDGCECPVTVAAVDNAKKCVSSAERRYWWDEPTLSELNVHQSHQLLWVKAKHMVYDYCTDTARFPVMPTECVHHRH